MSGGRAALALLAGVVGGLLLAGSTAAEWFAVAESREIGGVPVPGEGGVAGGRVAAELLPLGLVAAAASLALGVLRGRLRRLAGAALLALAAASVWPVARPVVGGAPGEPAAGLGAAAAGVVLLVAAGVLALRGDPPPRLSARYDLDADDADEEWRLASGGEPGERGEER